MGNIKNLRKLSGWTLLSTLIIISIVIPSLFIIVQSFQPLSANWQHIKEYLLGQYVLNTIVLILFVGIMTAMLGAVAAWLVTAFEFPGRKILSWALMLPIAIPPYIGAYIYHGMLNYTGVVQRILRNIFHIEVPQQVFNIMNMNGAIFIFAIFLYPYVYMTTRSYLRNMSASIIESSRLLGKGFYEIFIRVIIPMLRISLAGGVSLVVLEVLNDYGVVKYFGVSVFSTAIYNTWFGMGDINSAVQLAVRLMMIVLIVIGLEKSLQGRKKYFDTNSKLNPIKRFKLTGSKKIYATIFGFALVLLGFILPVMQLITWTSLVMYKIQDLDLVNLVYNSLSVATVSSVIIIISALIIANFTRLSKGLLGKVYAKVTVMGYSIPASIIAIGVMTTFLAIDRNLYPLYQLINPNTKKLVLTTSLVMLIAAYFVRFLAIGFNPIESGFAKIGTRYYESSRTLGRTLTQTFFEVEFPMIRGSVFTALILVFVDVLKELPLTLILRPFNFNTLATRVFEYANDEMIHEASISSLIIIIISVISIYFLNKLGNKEKKNDNNSL